MNGMLLLSGVIVLFLIAYLGYGAFLKRTFGIDNSRPCPSETKKDGIDYIPTPLCVLFGHHFASIAGAGPIVGPVLAAYLGWGPAMMWIVLGCIFIGSMHDFAAMFLSVRNDGRSIAYIIEKELGYAGRQIFLFFCVATLILVVAVFTSQVASSFVTNPAVATSSILFIIIAPVFGIMTGKKILGLAEGTLVFVPILFVCVWAGTLMPFDLIKLTGCSKAAATNIWAVVLLYYALCASILPVWVLLQPRDYLNSYLLYVMMILGFAGIACYRPELHVPAFACKSSITPGLFPLLFVTIACGACSGFHAIVASGTSSKQIAKENHVLPVGYGGMLIEGVLATMTIISVCYLNLDELKAMLNGPDKVPPAVAFAKGLAQFSTKLGLSYDAALNFVSLSISAFMLTSLDTATRLARFIWQEMVLPKGSAESSDNAATQPAMSPTRQFFASRWTSTVIIILLGGWLVLSGEGNHIWPIFGAGNQLLAALTLLAVSLWLMRTKRPVLFALLPMFFMLLISGWALVILIKQNISKNWSLVFIAAFLLVMALALLALSFKKMQETKAAQRG
ncbi:MAG: carbon starvation protein A [Victivallales bacterium]|nr:carbon starvation protein A [Victivallales bacterium]